MDRRNQCGVGSTEAEAIDDLKEKLMERVILSVDGNAGCALLGENLQEGEAEFVAIGLRLVEPLYAAEIRSCWTAFNALKTRLGRHDLSYAWYPRKPGSAGA